MKGQLLILLFSLMLMVLRGEDVQRGLSPSTDEASFTHRERASRELWAQGEAALNLLKAQSLGNDPEVAWRAQRLLRWTDLGMTPQTPEEVVELVEAYLQATGVDVREKIFAQLFAKEAYVQLFRLPKYIRDESARNHLVKKMGELSGEIASTKILEGKQDEALAILEEGRGSRGGNLRWLTLAYALRHREQLWEEFSDEDKVLLARWEGDVKLVEELASDEHEVRSSLRLLSGDPSAFIAGLSRRGDSVGVRAQLLEACLEEGREGEKAQEILQKLVEEISSLGVTEASDSLQILRQAGYAEEFLKFFKKDFPVEAFEYLQSQERVEEAFVVLGLKAGDPIPDQWMDTRIQQIQETFDLENPGCREILTVALSLVERGDKEEAAKMLRKLLKTLEKQGAIEVNALIALLSGQSNPYNTSGYPELAIQMAMEREEKLFSPENFLAEAFLSDGGASQIFQFAKKQFPELEEWHHVRLVCGFYGREVDISEEFIIEMLKRFEAEAQENQSLQAWGLLLESAKQRGDVPLLERTLRTFIELEAENEANLSDLGNLLLADGRYEDAVTIFQQLNENQPGRLEVMKFLIVALTQAGREEEAQPILQLMEELALGSVGGMVSLGKQWGAIGEYERQQELYMRAFLFIPSGSRLWFDLLGMVAKSAQLARNWKVAVACQEAVQLLLPFEGQTNPIFYLRPRGEIEFMRAMVAFEDEEREAGIRLLAGAVEFSAHHGFFADEVFPALWASGHQDLVKEIWAQVAPVYRRSLELFPKAHNALNTSAWVASRAACDLVEAGQRVTEALSYRPRAAAYLDTKAEVFFAQGKREEALKWSEKACRYSRGVAELSALRVQYRHFRDDFFPPLRESNLNKD